jgi:hypothetical protein
MCLKKLNESMLEENLFTSTVGQRESSSTSAWSRWSHFSLDVVGAHMR